MSCRGIILMCLLAAEAPAGEPGASRLFGAHETRGAFLLRSAGARAAGMGEAFVAVSDDATAVCWNPAGLARLRAFGAAVMHDAAGHGMGLSRISVASPLGTGVGGAAVSVFSYGEYEMRDAGGVRLGTESLHDLAVAGAFAVENPGWLGTRSWSGVAFDMVREGVGGELAGFGLGVMAALSPRLRAAAVARQFGPAVKGGTLPAVVKGGIAYAALSDLDVAMDAGYGIVDGELSFAVGGELKVHEAVVLRSGYRWVSVRRDWRGLDAFAFGFGARLGGLGVDYACRPFGDFATTHMVSLLYSARAVPDRARGAVLHSEAAELYSEGLYESALRRAMEALAEDPLMWRTWGVIGNCRYRQGDTRGALDAYARCLELNPDNPRLRVWMERLKPGEAQPRPAE